MEFLVSSMVCLKLNLDSLFLFVFSCSFSITFSDTILSFVGVSSMGEPFSSLSSVPRNPGQAGHTGGTI